MFHKDDIIIRSVLWASSTGRIILLTHRHSYSGRKKLWSTMSEPSFAVLRSWFRFYYFLLRCKLNRSSFSWKYQIFWDMKTLKFFVKCNTKDKVWDAHKLDLWTSLKWTPLLAVNTHRNSSNQIMRQTEKSVLSEIYILNKMVSDIVWYLKVQTGLMSSTWFSALHSIQDSVKSLIELMFLKSKDAHKLFSTMLAVIEQKSINSMESGFNICHGSLAMVCSSG